MDQSVLKIAQEMKPVCPPLADELTIISREQRAGMPRLDAWRNMADRVNVDIVRQFVGMLTQSEKFGTPVARSLAVFAEALRTKRTLQAEEMAAKTAIKLVFPLMFCIFPAMFVVLLGPAVISIMNAFQQ
jgi:tight adherence protein C